METSSTMSNTISLKFVLKDGNGEPEVRRFTVDRRIGTSLTSLQKLLATIYPNLGFKPFKLTWTDVDGDKVSIGSDNELSTAMNEMKGPVYKFNVEVPQEKKKNDFSVKREDETHFGVTCDACQRPIAGPRYKCVTCPDFDLCKICEEKGSHLFHNMVRIAAPKKICPQLYLPLPGNIRYGPFSVTPRNNFCQKQEAKRSEGMSQNSSTAKSKFVVGNPTAQSPIRVAIRNLSGEVNEPVKTETRQTKRGLGGKSEDPKMQVIETPFGKMFYWLGNSSEDEKPEPEPEKPKEDEKCGGSSNGFDSTTDDDSMPNGLELQLIETPFGKMFYWVRSDCQNKETKTEKPREEKTEEDSASKTYEIKINRLPQKENQPITEENSEHPNNEDQPKDDLKKEEEERNQTNNEPSTATKNAESSPHTSDISDDKETEKSENTPETTSDDKKSENEVVEQNSSTEKARNIEEALEAMLNMGFTDDGGWLTKLLESKRGKDFGDLPSSTFTFCN